MYNINKISWEVQDINTLEILFWKIEARKDKRDEEYDSFIVWNVKCQGYESWLFDTKGNMIPQDPDIEISFTVDCMEYASPSLGEKIIPVLKSECERFSEFFNKKKVKLHPNSRLYKELKKDLEEAISWEKKDLELKTTTLEK